MTSGCPEIFTSFTGGGLSDDVEVFIQHLTQGLDHQVAKWTEDPHVSGDLPNKLKDQMRECRVFLLFITTDYARRMANHELDWLIEFYREDPDWASQRMVIPVMMTKKAKNFWAKQKKRANFPDPLRDLVRLQFFDDATGACDLHVSKNGRAITNSVRFEQIEALREEVVAFLSSNPCIDRTDSPPRSNTPTDPSLAAPKIYLFGGMAWKLQAPADAARDALLGSADLSLGQDHRHRLINVGDDWDNTRQRRLNSPLFAHGGTAHAVIVGDRELLDNLRQEDLPAIAKQGSFAEAMSEEVDQNLSGKKGWTVKERLIWLPSTVEPVALDASETSDMADFRVFDASPAEMMNRIRELLGIDADATVLYQKPGRNFEDIATWARTHFAKEVSLCQPNIDRFNDHDDLFGQLTQILSEGSNRIILIACDGMINAGSVGKWGAKALFEERLRSVEMAVNEALEDASERIADVRELKFGRIFLQYRNPSHQIGELVANLNAQQSAWVPLRFDDALASPKSSSLPSSRVSRTPCPICMKAVRDEIERVCL